MKHNWEYKNFGSIADILYGFPFDSSRFNTDAQGMPLIRIRDVKPGCTSTFYDGKYSEEYLVKKGELLVGMDGEFNIAPWKSEDALLNQRVCRIKSKNESRILSKYFFFFLKIALKRIEEQTSFVTVKHLSAKVLCNISTPVPPMEVQERIVAELDKINELIEQNRELLRHLDALAQSLFYDTFGDPVTNPKGWDVYFLDKLGELGRGVSKHRPRNAPELLGGTMPLIQTGDIANAGIYITKYVSTYSELGVAQSKVWPKNTLCITIAANIGKTAITTFPACFPDSIVGFSVDKDVCNSLFIYYFFNAIQKDLEDNANGVAQKNINLAILSALKVPLPPLALQNQFAAQVEAIEAQKAIVEKSIAELQTLLDSRMDYWFN